MVFEKVALVTGRPASCETSAKKTKQKIRKKWILPVLVFKNRNFVLSSTGDTSSVVLGRVR